MLGLTSLIALWIPKIMTQIGLFVATEPPVFIASSVIASRFSIATFSLGLFLICVATYFVDVMT